MTKKETLRLSNLNDNDTIILLTIVSSESDIHLCQLINKIFNIKLSLSEDLIISENQVPVHFRKYELKNTEEAEKYILMLNRNNSGKYLFPEFKKIDYIFLIFPEMHGNNYDMQIKKLKEESTIAAIFKIDPDKIKSFKKLKL